MNSTRMVLTAESDQAQHQQAQADAEEIRAAFPDVVGEGPQQRQGFGASAAAADGL